MPNERETITLNASRDKVDRKKLEEEFRNKRVPFGGDRLKLSVPKLDGYRGYWFKDVGGRIQDAINAGYQFVDQSRNLMGVGTSLSGNTDLGTYVSKVTGTLENGQPQRCYLMYIRNDWYLEDVARKDAPLKEIDRTIRRGKFKVGPEEDKMYVPRDGISIKETRR